MAYMWMLSYVVILRCGALAACAGEQCAAADDVGNFLQAGIKVTMDNYNGGMGTTAGDVSPYELAAVGSNACPVGRGVSQAACSVAGNLVGGKNCHCNYCPGGLATGHWGHVPAGCSIHPGSKCTHWNTHSAPNSPGWQPVCKVPMVSPYELAAVGSNACPGGRAVSQEDCLVAGSLVGGKNCNCNYCPGGLATGHWGHVPAGCSIHPGSKCTHWNTHSAPNSPGWQPVCKVPTTTTTKTTTTTTTTVMERENYLYVGNGCCRDKFDKRPTFWAKRGITEASCMEACDAQPGCSAYNFINGYCQVYGPGGRYGDAAPSGWTKEDRGWATEWEWNGDGGVISKARGTCGVCFKKKPVNGYDIVGVGWCLDRWGMRMTSWTGPVMSTVACRKWCDYVNEVTDFADCEGYKAQDQDACVLYGKQLSSNPTNGWSYNRGHWSLSGMRVARSTGFENSVCMKKT